MGFLNTNCRSQRQCGNSCSCSCAPAAVAIAEPTAVAGATTEVIGPQTVRTLLNTVIDSCCVTDDVCRELVFCDREMFDTDELEVGDVIDVKVNGDITFKEVNREKDDCVCVSSVRYNIPIRFRSDEDCGCRRTLDRDITVIRSVRLCCTSNSILTTFNTKVLAISAVVSEICCDRVTITLCILFRSCIQQTMVREYELTATPVCIPNNCNDARESLLDSCDTVCGCTAGFSCPSC